jgi:MFS transporter, SP family, sugar:H+ symporter
VFQKFVGINVIFYYSTTLWKAVGFSASNAFIISVISSVINILTTFVAISTIDRVGRKPLLVIGSIGMTLSLATMAVIFGFATKDAAGAPVLTGAGGAGSTLRRQSVRDCLWHVLGAGGLGFSRRIIS